MSHSESMPMCCAARESLNKSGEARDDALMTLDKVAALTRTKLFAALDANAPKRKTEIKRVDRRRSGTLAKPTQTSTVIAWTYGLVC